jgi:hypothetical protein
MRDGLLIQSTGPRCMISTPTTREWSNMTLKAKLVAGTTKAAECKSCGKNFACNAGHVRKNFA